MKTLMGIVIGFFIMVTMIQSTILRKDRTKSQLSKNLMISSAQPLQRQETKDRLLTVAGSASKPNYVITSWIKKYPTRNDVCHYLCQSDSFFGIFSEIQCYVSHRCTSVIWQSIIFWLAIFSYGILPVFMILLGIWKFRCLGKYLAVMTGIVFLNIVYEKLSKDFEEDMETDYDISNSEIESDIKSASLNSD